MAAPTLLEIDATQQTLEITSSRDAISLRGRSIETGTPTDGEVMTYSTSSSEWIYQTITENVDDRVAALIQDSAGGGLTWTYDDSAGTLTPAYVGDSTLVTSGALNSGSITSGFGAIDVGSSSIDGGTITGTFVGPLTGLASTATLAATVTVVDESSDTACFPAFFNASTGSLAVKTDASGLTYNSSTGGLAANAFTGPLVGNADTATLATTATLASTVTVTDESSDTSCFPAFFIGSTGSLEAKTDASGLTYNAATGTLAANAFTGPLNGIVGGTTPAAGAFTTISGSASLVLATGATVTGIDDGSLGSSATLLATQGAIKTYVDAQVTAQDLDIISDTGNIDIDLDSESLTLAGGTGLASSASSTTVTFAIDSTVATLAGSQTLTNKSIAGSANTLSAIANSSLTNSTVAYGGVTLSLGGADSTPAFNLSDATVYPGDSSLVTTGALNSGSITSGFTSIDVGSGAITTTGTVSATTLTGTLSTVAQTNITSVGALAAGSIASGFTSISTSYTDAKVTSVVAGTLIDVSGATGDVTVNTDLSELSTSTSDGDGDYFAVVDAANAQKKLTKANISIAGFNTAVATSITGVGTLTAGTWTADVISGAYIDATSSPLASTKIWIGSGSNVAAEFALSGNATMTAGGVVTVSTAAACTGNAATATALQTARTIGGTSFDGTANIAVALSATTTALASARTIGGTSFDGTANIAVALSATATALATARAINGTDFDGTAAITVTAAAGTLTGATLNSGVTASSLTSVGTLTSLGVGAITGSGALSVDDTTQSTSTTTGSIHTDGGLGVVKDVFIGGDIAVAGTGPHAIGRVVSTGTQMIWGGSFTSLSPGSSAQALNPAVDFTGGVGDTARLSQMEIGGTIITQGTDTNIGWIAGLTVNEPNITNNLASSGKPDVAATIYVNGAPTEGDVNAALYVASGDVMLPATGKLYFDGGANTYINEPAADQIDFYTGGGERLKITDTQFQIATDVTLASTKKLYLDGGSNTYLSHPSADTVRFTVGDTTLFQMGEHGGGANDYIQIPALSRFYLDGGSHTYLSQSSADNVRFVVGGNTVLDIGEGGGGLNDYIAIQTGNRFYLDGVGNTHISEVSSDVLRCVSGGSGGVDLTSGATSWAAVSDVREKVEADFEPITDALTKVAQLRSVIGRYTADSPDRRRAFLIGQDVQAVLPEAVTESPDGVLSLAYTETIPLLVAALNEGSARIRALETALAAL